MSDKELTRLIILGAGASVDCGVYPTGAELVEFAKKVLDWSEDDKTDIAKKTKPYLQNLIDSGHSSIDSHIAYIKDESEQKFLKSFIITTILACTVYSEISGKFGNNWYSEIVKLVFPTLANKATSQDRLEGVRERLENLQIITFNYDISLELYLRKAVKCFFGELNEDAKKAFEEISRKIHHVYGAVAYTDEILQIDFKDFKNAKAAISQGIDANKESIKDFIYYFKELREIFITNNFFQKVAGKVHENYVTPYKKFRDLLGEEKPDYTKKTFSLVLDNSNIIQEIEGSDNKTFSSDRIKVISEERAKIEKEVRLISNKSWGVVYILGYGFDQDNNKLLGLKEINWKRGCFVTNYEANKKLERIIYNELSREKFYEDFIVAPEEKRTSSDEDYFNPNDKIEYLIPLISNSSVKNALNNEFSLLEESEPLVIKTNLTPYLEMRNK